ncbi:hypothetical protein Q9R19_11225 [Microbacterium sp. ARD32]|uniref:hypothetical protein n=1 Tax=Microbacterium sp. ARD32 TaxID=2962577 RepID=UPI002882ADFE|nr:hypothetical protein [Microbacterium sp. ARD32]MDT0158197.1 hypothetical protein [Microbacterium sp. ARD32]
MSGPKGYAWEVAQEELRRQAAVSNARARIAMLRDEARAVCAALAAWGDVRTAPERPSIAASASSADAGEALASFEATVAALRDDLGHRERAAVAARLISSIPETVAGSIALDWTSAKAETTGASQRTAGSAADTTMELADVVPLLSQVDDETLRERWMGNALAATGSSALAGLCREVRGHLVQQRRVAAFRQRCARVIEGIADIASPQADAARRMLHSAVDESGLAEGASAARRARAAWERHAARQHVITQTAAVLAELGHTVDEGFVVDALEGDFVIAGTADPRYGLQLRFTDRGQMLTNTVALAESADPGADRQAEESECEALGELSRRLGESRIELVRTHAVAPGVVAMERRVRPATTRESERRRRSRSEGTIR